MKPKMKTKTKTKNLCYLIFSTYCISAVCSTSGAATVAFNKYVQAARKPGANQATVAASWKAAVDEAQKPPIDNARLAFALVHLGDSQCGTDNAKAVATYKRAVEVREKAHADNTLGMARNLERLAMMEMALKVQEEIKRSQADGGKHDLHMEFKEEQAQLQRALDLAQKFGADDELKYMIMKCLADAYYNNKEYDSAIKMANQMLELADKSPNTANAREKRMAGYGTLVNVYGDQKREKDEQAMLEKVGEVADAKLTKEQIKAKQDGYAKMEKQVDDSEERSFH
jgi:tetratricopeptide (TPR) repeat protein